MVTLIKKYKLFLSLIVLFLLFSCSGDEEREREIRRFKNEYRDPKLIGKWVSIDLATNQKDNYFMLFRKNAEFVIVYIKEDNTKKSEHVYYFYTNEDSIFVLDLGEGFKVGFNINEHKYKISNDTLTLEFKSGGIADKAVKVSDNPN